MLMEYLLVSVLLQSFDPHSYVTNEHLKVSSYHF